LTSNKTTIQNALEIKHAPRLAAAVVGTGHGAAHRIAMLPGVTTTPEQA
jgi:hypothetical protein